MDLRAEILKGYSQVQTDKIIAWATKDKQHFAQLMDLFPHDEYRVVQRTSWIMGHIGEKHEELVAPYLEKMVQLIQEPKQQVAVKRCIVRILQYVAIPEKLQGDAMNICFELLADPKEAIAVRCYAMYVLDKLSKTYPEIRPEMVLIIEDMLQQEPTPAIRAAAKKVLKKR